MNGIVSQRKPGNFEHDGKLIETDLEKANSFAESFAKISSNSNYSHAFMQYKQQAEKEYDKILTKTEYLTNGYRYGHSYYRRRTGNRIQAFKWYHFQ